MFYNFICVVVGLVNYFLYLGSFNYLYDFFIDE